MQALTFSESIIDSNIGNNHYSAYQFYLRQTNQSFIRMQEKEYYSITPSRK